MITITPINLEQVENLIAHIPGTVEKATKNSVRQTLKDARREIISKVKARYTSPISLFTQSLKVKSSGLTGEIKSVGAKNPLEKFKVSPKHRITGRGRYLKAVVIQGQGGILERAFMKSTSMSIFERVGASRFPIHKLKSVAAPSMLNVEQVREPVLNLIERQFQNHFISEVNKFL